MKSRISALTLSLVLTLLAASAALAADQTPAAPAVPGAPASPPARPSVATAPAAPASRGRLAPRSPDAPAASTDTGFPGPGQRQLEAERRRLDAARERLEVAAQEVARLSARMSEEMAAQMSGQISERVSREVSGEMRALAGPPRALIGVQLAAAGGSTGARVLATSPGGPAERAGVRAGDVIVAVDGHPVRGHDPPRRVLERLRGVRPGDKVALRIMRNGAGRDINVIARAGLPDLFLVRPFPHRVPQPPSLPALARWGAPVIIRGPIADMELAGVTPGLGRYFGTKSGVLVVRAPPHGALALKDGDVILSIGARRVLDSSHVIRILSSYDPGERIRMEVLRAHRQIELSTRMPAGPATRRILMMPQQLPPGNAGPDLIVRSRGGVL